MLLVDRAARILGSYFEGGERRPLGSVSIATIFSKCLNIVRVFHLPTALLQVGMPSYAAQTFMPPRAARFTVLKPLRKGMHGPPSIFTKHQPIVHFHLYCPRRSPSCVPDGIRRFFFKVLLPEHTKGEMAARLVADAYWLPASDASSSSQNSSGVSLASIASSIGPAVDNRCSIFFSVCVTANRRSLLRRTYQWRCKHMV